MTTIVTKTYDFLRSHRILRRCSFVIVTLLLVALFAGQHYQEDITDFLPMGTQHRKAMSIYQEISGANRLFVIFQSNDGTQMEPDSLVSAMETYQDVLSSLDTDGLTADLFTQFDFDQLNETADFVYRNIPYFLTDADYERMDSLLNQESYITDQLHADKQLLMFPVSGLFSDNMQRDPLNLFTPVVSSLEHSAQGMNYEVYDGYIFSPDMCHSLMMLSSPYGSSETEHNALLVRLLESAADSTTSSHNNLSIHVTGGPSVAVGNARQIRMDSLLSVSLAVLLIVGLLYYSLRSVRNLLLIVLSIAWGWLFAMGMLSVVHDNVSVIVIGISSIILGIAFNYPLHLIAHMQHTPTVRTALKEIAPPLIVGNITTVGAFLALVPLQSQALRDLGLFSSFLLIGTILFVLLYLPHAAKARQGHAAPSFISKVGMFKPENKRWLVIVVVILTIIFGYFSLGTTFDVNLSHINYMTKEQRADMDYMQQMVSSATNEKTLYVVYEGKTMDEALELCQQRRGKTDSLQKEGKLSGLHSCFPLLCTRKEQERRLAQWSDFLSKHREAFERILPTAARQAGFADGSFADFHDILHAHYEPQDYSYFSTFSTTALGGTVSTDSVKGVYSVVDHLYVDSTLFEGVKQQFPDTGKGVYAFDIEHMNSAIATTLSDNFNYIGWVCGLIVFFFLWFSMGSIELALLSFLPMAVSWLWIMGIMTLLGIHFNMVNVVLATFIFGQGDDYTIFMTEGCQYEYAYRKKMIASYKNSIIISALIMFFGIGTLIFAKHPALHSLAEVTIIGMFTVVFMAYLIPPLLFKWLVSKNGIYRKRPLTIRRLLHLSHDDDVSLVLDKYRYKGYDILSAVKRHIRRHDNYKPWTDREDLHQHVIVMNNGYGEFSLLMALRHPDKTFVAYEDDEEKRLLAKYSAEGLVNNLSILPSEEDGKGEGYVESTVLELDEEGGVKEFRNERSEGMNE